jgi:hypothetical protein
MTIQEKYRTHRYWTLYREWDGEHRVTGYVAINSLTLQSERPPSMHDWYEIERWWNEVKQRPSLPPAPTYEHPKS